MIKKCTKDKNIELSHIECSSEEVSFEERFESGQVGEVSDVLGGVPGGGES